MDRNGVLFGFGFHDKGNLLPKIHLKSEESNYQAPIWIFPSIPFYELGNRQVFDEFVNSIVEFKSTICIFFSLQNLPTKNGTF